jgi:hypothetical protein
MQYALKEAYPLWLIVLKRRDLPWKTNYVSIHQHTSAYISIREHTSEYVSIRQLTLFGVLFQNDAIFLGKRTVFKLVRL